MRHTSEPQATTPFATPRCTTRFETHSRDDAVEFMEGLYGPHSLRLQGRDDLHMRLAGFDMGGLNLSTVTYGVPGIAQLLQARNSWVFTLVACGATAVGRDAAGVGDAGALAPDTLREIPMSSDLRLVNLRVDTASLQSACRTLLGRDLERPLHFPARVPAGSPMALTLSTLVQRVTGLPTYDHPAARALERRHQEAVLFELLMTWPHAYSAELAAPAVVPRSIQRARDFIHAHVHELPSLGDIAAAAGIGVRALTRGFEKWLGTSPMRYATQCRLDAARHELLDAVGGATVTQIAFRCGFTNLGDFAAHYRQRFGELPHETLHRKKY